MDPPPPIFRSSLCLIRIIQCDYSSHHQSISADESDVLLRSCTTKQNYATKLVNGR